MEIERRGLKGAMMESQREIESPRFLWVAALTMATSVIAVLVVRAAAVRILHPNPNSRHSHSGLRLLTRYFASHWQSSCF